MIPEYSVFKSPDGSIMIIEYTPENVIEDYEGNDYVKIGDSPIPMLIKGMDVEHLPEV